MIYMKDRIRLRYLVKKDCTVVDLQHQDFMVLKRGTIIYVDAISSETGGWLQGEIDRGVAVEFHQQRVDEGTIKFIS